jgi:membrane-bound serine protease (ClpP class)
MIRPPAALVSESLVPVLAILLGLSGPVVNAQESAAALPQTSPGQSFEISEPITDAKITQIRAAALQMVDMSTSAEDGRRPILIFEFRPGQTAPGKSAFGACYDLANLISKELAGAKLTVAYIPEPLKGYVVLPALACTEIVMGSAASLGPITPEGQAAELALREPVRFLAMRKTREPDLLLGMLDRDLDLRRVRTTQSFRYLLPDSLKEFEKTHQVIENVPAWDAGLRGVYTAKRASDERFCKRIAESPDEVMNLYQLDGRSTSDDPTLGTDTRLDWFRLNGLLDNTKASYLARKIELARQEKVNLLIIEIDSPGGMEDVGDRMADLLSAVKDMKTVAYIDDRATGVAALLPLACRDIVFKKGARMGDVRHTGSGGGGPLHDLNPVIRASLAEKAALLAREKRHPEALAIAMVDPDAEVVLVSDSNTAARRLLLRTQYEADRGRYQLIQTRKEPGFVMTVRAEDAAGYGLGQVVNDSEELKNLYGLRGRSIRVDGPGWVDSLVAILTDPYVSWMLLFIGVLMMVVELKLPGIGLPAIISAVAFILFFWSKNLSGTADQLEILLFLIGLVCVAIELFVLPGFGVFGMSGILLMLCSIVLASHSFVWPTQDYEYQELGHTLLQLTGMLLAVGGCVIALARYLPTLPLLNRLVLRPEPWTIVEPDDSITRPDSEGYESLAFLIGETGRTTSPLRPAGKARFGSRLIDVTTAGRFVEPDSLIEVVDVQGTRVIVKRVGS